MLQSVGSPSTTGSVRTGRATPSAAAQPHSKPTASRSRPDDLRQQYAFPFGRPIAATTASFRTRAARPGTSPSTPGRLWQAPSSGSIRRSIRASGSATRSALPDLPAAKPTGRRFGALHADPAGFVRQTIDLGGETRRSRPTSTSSQAPDRESPGDHASASSASRDIFDTNKYAHDPRSDFINWALVDTGTFDYAADAWAYTYGAAVEWYQGRWTLRGGLFDLSIAPNSTELDPNFRQFQWIGEIEHRHELWGQPGKVAVTGFLSRGRMGRFADASTSRNSPASRPTLPPCGDITSRTGISLNVEQQLSPDVGVFARAGWASGDVEPYEFTDIDRTLAAGVIVSGKQLGTRRRQRRPGRRRQQDLRPAPGLSSTRRPRHSGRRRRASPIPAPRRSSRCITACPCNPGG